MSEHLDRCAVCNGTRQEHNGGTKHMFTLNAGELRLPPKVDDKVRKQGPDAALVLVSRLIETLVDKDLITQAEALAVFGVESKKPEPSEVVDVDPN